MSTENKDNNKINENNEVIAESMESMDDFKDEINSSFKRVREGDLMKGTVISISDTEIIVDLQYYAEGIIKVNEISDDPNFSLEEDISVGDEIDALVVNMDDGEGNILLSKKKADSLLAWDLLSQDLDNKTIHKVKISNTVNSGVIAYLHGIRGFIPASQLSIAYVEDLEEWIGKEIEVIVITVDKDKNNLVLSGKQVELKKQEKDRERRMEELQVGSTVSGIVDNIMPYGAFIDLGDGLSGLVHISQIAHKRIGSPNEVLKKGEKINAKVLNKKDDKISLSIKAISDKDEVVEDDRNLPSSYQTGGEVTTSLGSLLDDLDL